jgi:hypothetical protein
MTNVPTFRIADSNQQPAAEWEEAQGDYWASHAPESR